MKYQTGRAGRVILVRLENGDAVLDEICGLVKRENIRAGIFYLIGGIKTARIVVGPEKEKATKQSVLVPSSGREMSREFIFTGLTARGTV
jgi:predicted DNA-binding protein with PD1-like motif